MGHRVIVDGKIPAAYRFEYAPDPEKPEDLELGTIPVDFSASVPVDQGVVVLRTREGKAGPEYQIEYQIESKFQNSSENTVLQWTNDVDALWADALHQLEDKRSLSE